MIAVPLFAPTHVHETSTHVHSILSIILIIYLDPPFRLKNYPRNTIPHPYISLKVLFTLFLAFSVRTFSPYLRTYSENTYKKF